MPNPPRYNGTIPEAFQITPRRIRTRVPQTRIQTPIETTYQRFDFSEELRWIYQYSRQLMSDHLLDSIVVHDSIYIQPLPQRNQPMFNIGDSVYYYSITNHKKYYGIIKELDPTTAKVLFEEDFATNYNTTRLYRIRTGLLQLEHKEPPLSIEQQVSNRCKKLWNESNYVKRNPSYAY